MARISGNWFVNAQPGKVVPLHGQRDPQHAHPDDAPLEIGRSDLDRDGPPAPDLPAYLLSPPDAPLGNGYTLDYTPYDHGDGLGTNPAQPREVSQVQAESFRSEDTGTPDYIRYTHAPNILSGDPRDQPYQLAMVTNTPLDGEPVGQVDMQRAGVGAPHDHGLSRLSRRQKRWRDRYIEYHRFEPVMQPNRTKTAKTGMVTRPVPGGSSNSAPAPSVNGVATTPHPGWAQPALRRSPEPWQSPTDPSLTGGAYGLTGWGL